MGWSWAVFFIQAAHKYLMDQAAAGTGVADAPWMLDKRHAVHLSGPRLARLLYIDNFAALGCQPRRVEEALLNMESGLNSVGLVHHREGRQPQRRCSSGRAD